MTASRSRRSYWAAVISVVIFSLPAVSWAWGGRVHRWVNEKAFQHLPMEMAGFERWSRIIAAHASDADARKATDPLEGPRHWIDIDNYPEFYAGSLSHDLDSLRAQHSHHLDVYGNGVVPWTIAGVTESLSVVMAGGEWSQAVLLAADLGHYVADCHQPLHTTANYDGQLTGHDGVHLRYEIHMVERYLAQLRPDSSLAVYIEDPLEHIFATIPGTWMYVDSILNADRQARKRSPTYSAEYYRIMWEKTGPFTIGQLGQSARVLADLWYTAWVDAGQPEFPPPAEVEVIANLEPGPETFDLVTVQGVVTMGSGVLDDQRMKVYIQDQSGRGILLFDHRLQEGISRGDLVRVEGMAQDYHGLKEIIGPSVTVLERGHPSPSPQVLSTGEAKDSRWDNTLISVRGKVVFALEDESWTRLHLDDGSGAVVVLVRSETGIDLDSVREGDVLTVSGVGAYLMEEGSRAIMPGYDDQVLRDEVVGEAKRKDSKFQGAPYSY